MSSNVCHQIIYLAIELSSSSWVIAYRLPANDKAKVHRLEAGDGAGLLAFIAGLRHGWILLMTPLRLSSAALRPGGMDFGCIDFSRRTA
jgi:hypothetical protein